MEAHYDTNSAYKLLLACFLADSNSNNNATGSIVAAPVVYYYYCTDRIGRGTERALNADDLTRLALATRGSLVPLCELLLRPTHKNETNTQPRCTMP